MMLVLSKISKKCFCQLVDSMMNPGCGQYGYWAQGWALSGLTFVFLLYDYVLMALAGNITPSSYHIFLISGVTHLSSPCRHWTLRRLVLKMLKKCCKWKRERERITSYMRHGSLQRRRWRPTEWKDGGLMTQWPPSLDNDSLMGTYGVVHHDFFFFFFFFQAPSLYSLCYMSSKLYK